MYWEENYLLVIVIFLMFDVEVIYELKRWSRRKINEKYFIWEVVMLNICVFCLGDWVSFVFEFGCGKLVICFFVKWVSLLCIYVMDIFVFVLCGWLISLLCKVCLGRVLFLDFLFKNES